VWRRNDLMDGVLRKQQQSHAGEQQMTAIGSRTGDAVSPSVVRSLVRRIVDGVAVAVGQKYHLKVVFSDRTTHDTTRLGEPDVTIIFRNRRAEWRMVLGGMFEFLESYFDGDVDIVGEQGLRKLVNIGYRKTFGRFEHPLTLVKRHILEWRQNNKDFAQAKRNAAFHYGLPTEFFRLVASQNDAMRQLMKARNFSGKLTLVEKDHRKLANEPDRYDRFVSIGVHEHAGRDGNEQWIASIARGLRPGGIGLISATFNMQQRPTNYCTIKHIFPGGYIPSLARTLIFMAKHGLNVTTIENLSYHYHRTVERWLRNFEAHWERIRAIDPQRFDEKFRRTWLFYLGGAAETFEAAREIINCYHITFCKGHFSGAAP
jgi:hypothetical protein